MAKKTKIDWATSSWNPVTGCLHGCPYCYARKICERFAGGVPNDGICHDLGRILYDYEGQPRPYPFGFAPTFHRYRLHDPTHWKESRNIFVGSMADLFGEWVPEQWITDVFQECDKTPRHRYLFLTKNPARYVELYDAGKLPDRDNFWYGSTVTDSSMPFFFAKDRHCFLSVEPIQDDMGDGTLAAVQWVIVGAETGNRRNRVEPKKAWIDHISQVCDKAKIPVFQKESLRELMGKAFRQDFPWSK